MITLFSDAELRDGFAVRYHPNKGRHIIAARPFAPGAIILQQEPYAYVLSDERMPDHCDFCFRPCERPLRCSRSKLARYCCKEHQRCAWAAGYRTECEALVRCAPRVPPPTVRLAARLLWRRARSLQQQQQQQQQQGQPSPPGAPDWPHLHHMHHHSPPDSDHAAVWQLQHHWEQLDDRRKELYAQMAVVTRQYMYGAPDGSAPPPPDGSEEATSSGGGGAATTTTGGSSLVAQKDAAASAAAAPPPSSSSSVAAAAAVAPSAPWPGFRSVAQLLSLLACNCHTVCDEELRPLGTALYPTGALANHSCQPSAVQTFRGRTLQLRALRPLVPGDEVTLAYIELAATRQERREALADSYFFDINTMQAAPEPELGPASASAAAANAVTAPAGANGAAAAAGDAADCQTMEVDPGVSGRDGLAASTASAAVAASPTASARIVDAVGAGGGATASLSGGGGGAAHVAGGPGRCPGLAVRPPPLLTLDVGPNAQLHVFSSAPTSNQPPWLTDPRDGELTRVEWGCSRSDGSGGSSCSSVSSGSSGSLKGGSSPPLTGGLLARFVPRRPNEPKEAEDEGGEEEEEEPLEVEDEGQDELGSEGEGQLDGERNGASCGGDGGGGGGPGGCRQGFGPGGGTASPSRGGERQQGRSGFGAALSAARRSERMDIDPPPPMTTTGTTTQHQLEAAAVGGAHRCKPPLALELRGMYPAAAAARSRPRIELLAWGPWLAELVRTAGRAARSGGAAVAAAGTPAQGTAAASPPHPAVAGLLRRCVTALELSQRAEAAAGSGEPGEAVGILQRALQLLDSNSRDVPTITTSTISETKTTTRGSSPSNADSPSGLSLGPDHILRLRLTAQLLKAAVDAGSSGSTSSDSFTSAAAAAAPPPPNSQQPQYWLLALRAARALEPRYRLCCPPACPAWPILSLHYATLAKLELLTGSPRRALRAAQRAMVGLRLTHEGSAAAAPAAGMELPGPGPAGGGGGGGCVVDQVVRTGREAEMELRVEVQRQRVGDGGEDGRGLEEELEEV